MPRVVRRRLKPIALMPFAALIAIAGCHTDGQKQPYIRLASLDKLKAAVPKELLVEIPEDKAGEARYRSIVALGKTLDPKDGYSLTENWDRLASQHAGHPQRVKVSEQDQQRLVDRIWKGHPHLVDDLTAILKSGPLANSYGRQEQYPSSLQVVTLVRLLVFSADSYASTGQLQRATNLIVASFRLADSMLAAPGNNLDYLTAVVVDGMLSVTTDAFSKPDFPAEDCAAILAAAKPAPKQDDYAARSIQVEFVREALPDFAKNLPKETGAGSYDAIETAKAMAKLSLIAIANTRRPFSQADTSYFRFLLNDATDVLKQIYGKKLEGPFKGMELETLWSETENQVSPSRPPTPDSPLIRSSLNRIHNCLGRMELASKPYDVLPQISCTWRATRDLTRILLASRIYRASHGGKLPDSTAGFVPQLGEWPTNPFDGKPFTYLPKQEKVYGVRQDLIDHGGDIGTGYPNGKDAGISLKLTK